VSRPAVALEDQLLRRLIQDKLVSLRTDPQQLLQAAELLADSLIQARAAVKWLVAQRHMGAQPESCRAQPPRAQ
jgi:parvulin-like peptidyl-prolyl isomerase